MAIFTPSQLFRAKVAMLESAGDPLAANPKSSARGLYQFTKGTAKAYDLADPLDPVAATEAFDRLAADNYAILKKRLGREPTEGELYLAHQQGGAGAAKLLKNPQARAVDVVGADAVKNNGGKDDMTAGDFANLWLAKYEKAKPADLAGIEAPQAPQVADATAGGEFDPLGAGDYLAQRFAENQQQPQGLIKPMAEYAQADNIKSDAPDFSADAEVLDFSGAGEPVIDKKSAFKAMDYTTEPDTGKFRTAVDQFNQGTLAGWADEITDPLGALGAAAMSGKLSGNFDPMNPDDVALAESIAGARESTQRNLAAQREVNPKLAFGSQMGGALTGAIGSRKFVPSGVSTRAAQFAKANPATAAMLIGGSGAGVYSAGASEKDGLDRLEHLPRDVGFGVAGGYAGYKLAQGASKLTKYLGERFGDPVNSAMNAARDKTQAVGRALGILDDVTPAQASQAAGAAADPLADAAASGNITPKTLAGIFDENDLAKLEQGKVLPLTAGDRTQDVLQQRAEQTAATMGTPDAPINLARAKQREAIFDPFKKVLGDEQLFNDVDLAHRTQDEIGAAAGIVRDQYDDLGRRVNSAYTTARTAAEGAGRPIAIAGENIKNDLLGGIQETLALDAYRPGDIPKLDKHLKDLSGLISEKATKTTVPGMYGSETIVSKELTPAKLATLENWKKRLNRTISNTLEPGDSRLLKMVGAKYDEFLSNLADDAIVNGDETAIRAFKEARGLAKDKFAFYESDKAIQKILDNRDLSGTQLVNTILGAGKLAGSKGEDGRIVETMLKLAGDKAPEMRASMQKGVMAKILNDGIRSQGKSETKAIFDMAGAMNTSLKGIMKNRETFNVLFDETEQKYWRQMSQDLEAIAGKQIGAINRSGSGTYTSEAVAGLGRLFSNPVFNSLSGMVKLGMEKKAAAELVGKAESGLEEFFVKAINEVDAKPQFYGGYVGGMVVDPLADQISDKYYGGAQ